MKKRLIKKEKKKQYQRSVAALLQTIIFNPGCIDVSEETSTEVLLDLLEGRYLEVLEWLSSTFSFEEVENLLDCIDYSFPYGKLVKRLQKRPLGRVKNSDLALWRDHYLSTGRFEIRYIREWLEEEWGTSVMDD
jgi:hypothetical protein